VSPPRPLDRDFVAALKQLADTDDRAALAALRRGLGRQPGEAAEPYRVLLSLMPFNAPRWQEDACLLIAGLFAWHPRPWTAPSSVGGPSNLGASLRMHADQNPGGGPERRLVAALNAESEDLPSHLRHLVGLLRASDTSVDWAQLLRDVQDWSAESRHVQRDWARAFWQRAPSEVPASTHPAVVSDPAAASSN
jgi:CRISPR system Cascade subunit CasB